MADDPTRRVQFPDRPVNTDWRVNLRPIERAREYGIEEGELYDVYVYTEEGEEVFLPDAKVGTHHRVTIPTRRAEKYNIERGDELDVFVVVPIGSG